MLVIPVINFIFFYLKITTTFLHILETMNSSDKTVLSRASLQLLVNNQKMSEKLSSTKSELLRYKKSARNFHEKFLIEKSKSEDLQNMAVTLLSRSGASCACENTENCENTLCAELSELAKELNRKKPQKEENMEVDVNPTDSSSSSSSSSSSDSE